MMRLTWATAVVILILAPTLAQQPAASPDARLARQGQVPVQNRPFPPLTAAERAQLTQVLTAWETQSKATKTLDCKFARWHFDQFAAPAGIHANRADGVIKYGAPDRGLFRVDSLVFYSGMEAEKPQYKAQTGQFGEYWVCNGKQLIEFDRGKQECRIQTLPPHMQGQQIINGPLPFVFNLDAQEIQTRYWVRLRTTPADAKGIVLVEAHPKRQEDRAQYKFVQVALDQQTMLPRALVMYAPNFDERTSIKYDHYEFQDLGRNKIGAGLQKFMGNFIPQKPPADWKIIQETFTAPSPGQGPTQGRPAQGRPTQGRTAQGRTAQGTTQGTVK